VRLSHDGFGPEQIEGDLGTRRIGRRVIVLDETNSTNDAAFALAGEPDCDGVAVFAHHQTAARGRLGRTWVSPRGASVLCSILLFESDQPDPPGVDPGTLTLAAGVATCDAVTAAATDIETTIRWPNDVYVRDRKVAGILIESRSLAGGRAYVVGVGVNCLQHAAHFDEALRGLATSLEAESRDVISRLTVARRLLVELDQWLADRADPQALRQAWLDRAEPLGQHIHLRQAGHDYVGVTVDVDPTAGLVVQLAGGGRRVFDPATTSLVPGGHRAGSEP